MQYFFAVMGEWGLQEAILILFCYFLTEHIFGHLLLILK